MAGNRDPSQEEIAALCREIQSEWSPQERWSRLRSDWRGSFVRADGIRVEMSREAYDDHHNGAVSIDDDLDEPQD